MRGRLAESAMSVSDWCIEARRYGANSSIFAAFAVITQELRCVVFHWPLACFTHALAPSGGTPECAFSCSAWPGFY